MRRSTPPSSLCILRSLAVPMIWLLETLGASRGLAQDRLQVGDIVAQPGETSLTVPVWIHVDPNAAREPISRVRVALRYDPDALGSVLLSPVRDDLDGCGCSIDVFRRDPPAWFVEAGHAGVELGVDLASASTPWLAPGSSRQIAELEFCVLAGAPLGDSAVELVSSAIHVSGREYRSEITRGAVAEAPELEHGTVTVAGDVVGSGCPHDPPPPVPFDRPRVAMLSLGGALAEIGGSLRVPLSIRTTGRGQGLNWSIDFDETRLVATDAEQLLTGPDGAEFDFFSHAFSNDDDVPGGDGVEEGYWVGAAVFSFTDEDFVIPPDEDRDVIGFSFDVRSDAEPGTTEIRFQDGAPAPFGGPLANNVTVEGWPADLEGSAALVLLAGRVEIVGEISTFVRGDSDRDGTVGLSDAVRTLDYLFRESATLECFDAADANDDGKLDITDPVVTLIWLFQGGAALPAPVSSPGVDPTDDELGCSS